MFHGLENKEKLENISQEQKNGWTNKKLSFNQNKNSFLTVVMPAYNEEKNLGTAVDSLVIVLESLPLEYEILIINDGSKDNTEIIANDLSEKYSKVKAIHHKKNKGYGGAQLTGFKNAKGDYITIIPSDNQFDYNDLNKYVPHLEDSTIVIGYRVKRADPKQRDIYAKIYNFSLRFLFGLKVKDVDWVKIYKKSFLDSTNIESESALIDTELVIKAHKKKLKITEVPCNHLPRTEGTPTGNNIKVLMRELKEFIVFWFKHIGK